MRESCRSFLFFQRMHLVTFCPPKPQKREGERGKAFSQRQELGTCSVEPVSLDLLQSVPLDLLQSVPLDLLQSVPLDLPQPVPMALIHVDLFSGSILCNLCRKNFGNFVENLVNILQGWEFALWFLVRIAHFLQKNFKK